MTADRPLRRIGIVNRGEAAVRAIRAVKALRALEGSDLECVSFYTEVDRDAPFVRHADHAVRLASPRGSVAAYLDHEGLIAALRAAEVDAVWPGWGFVAEDAAFARKVADAGLTFLGPPADVMNRVGDKIAAKQLAESVGVPVIPWSDGPVPDTAAAVACARRIGFPLLIKATGGGGGRGIRVVSSEAGLATALESAAAEAGAAFGDAAVFIEKRLRGGRHVEVQIAADTHGRVAAVGCRDCSVQRRHQKVIEEAPPPGLPADLLAEISASAVRLVSAVGYVGVGTVEFLLADGAYYFLEVNPRLQVEHGITEELTGLDLVQLQIRIGRGEALPELPEPHSGVAIEARVCAEDPEADFLPSPGEIAVFDPSLGPRLRIDSGVAAGCAVPPDFDSLIAKVIACGATRDEARARLACALTDFDLVVRGGATNKGYLLDLLEAPEYREARHDTEWLDRCPELRAGSDTYAVEALVVAAILSYRRSRDAARRAFFADPTSLAPAALPPSTGQRIDLSRGGESYRLDVFAVGAWRYRVHLDGRVTVAEFRSRQAHCGVLGIGDRSYRVLYDAGERSIRVEVEAHPYRFSNELAGQVRAGTPALVIDVGVAVGDSVQAGQPLGLLEAMKMEIGFHAPVSGVVREIAVRPGQQVGAGELLLVIDADSEMDSGAARARLALPLVPDPLDLFFRRDAEGVEGKPDLLTADRAEPAVRRAAIRAARDEVRRVLMGYDVNPERGERLAAFLEAPLPAGLSDSFSWELADVRHELTLFADVEQLFVRSPRASSTGAPELSNYAQLRGYVQRLAHGGEGLTDEFREMLRAALPHYDATGLAYSEGLERAVLRILASQLAPKLRRRLVLGSIRRIYALAGRGIHLSDDGKLADSLGRIAGMRGLVPDALADLAIEASYAIFQGPEIERQAERTSKEVEGWLAAAESEITQPPTAVLAQIANAPLGVFRRVGRWLEDSDGRRRSVALAAHVHRLYAPTAASSHTSSVVGDVHIERLDLLDGRIVLGGVARRLEMGPVFERLARAASAAATSAPKSEQSPPGGVHAIEVLVPADAADTLAAVGDAARPFLDASLPAQRVTVTAVSAEGRAAHLTFARGEHGFEPIPSLHGVHPETAERIGLDRLRAFELERVDAPNDLYCFHLRAREVPGDERIFVLADVRGRSPDAGNEMTLHLPAFERAFFDATRTLRNTLGLRDPRRLIHWNRVVLFVAPPLILDPDAVDRLTRRLYPATRHLGLEKVIVRLSVIDADDPASPPRPVEIVIADPTGNRMEISWRAPHHEPLLPAQDYERKVVEARRRRLVYPYEIIRMLEGGTSQNGAASEPSPGELAPGVFEEFDLDAQGRPPVARSVAGRSYGMNESAIVFGVMSTPTEKHPEGMKRVLILSDPTAGMGSLAGPECDRIVAAIDLAERMELPVEWVPVSSGARIAMDSGTENLDATARVVRRIVTFTQGGGVIHVIVHGVNVGAQSYFNALSTMLPHTRGVLIMTPGASMVLTGRAALDASGSVSAEDEAAIGGFERVMGPNGEAQYYARNLLEAYRLLYDHYRFSHVAAGEPGPRRQPTADPADRDVTTFACQPEVGHDFGTIGDIFSAEANFDRKRPFAMRQVMAAVIDRDGGHLERWRSWDGAETAIVWDAHLGGHPVCLIGIESRNLPRTGPRASDGPASWTGGTLFPQSSKKVARALNACSGNRPVVVLANLSGFDGSPESMRRLQLEYGAEIARAVVNFQGPLVFLVVSRYHGGAYVVFSRALNPGLRAAALEGSFASVIGGGPAAAVVFAREVRARTSTDPRILELRRIAHERSGSEAREAVERAWQDVLLEKQSEIAAEFDSVHTVERALAVGSLEALVRPAELRAWLVSELSRGDA